MIPSLSEFQTMPSSEVARLIIETAGPQVCVLPVNGTRRWFMLEHPIDASEDWVNTYSDTLGRKNIELYRILLVNGINTLILPMFGGELLNRSQEYIDTVVNGFSRLATHPDFLEFYETEQVRVHFYGNYRKQFINTPYSYLIEQFDAITEKTAQHQRGRVFFGLFADNEVESIAQRTVELFKNLGRVPSRREMIEQYYGEYIEKANIFIGFEKFNVFDYPLLNWGEESLYYTVVPTLYMTEHTLRKILYDHIYLRPVQDPDYTTMPAEDFEAMRQFYITNRETVFGVGEIRGGIWYTKSGVVE